MVGMTDAGGRIRRGQAGGRRSTDMINRPLVPL
jgi:hypothetical protein